MSVRRSSSEKSREFWEGVDRSAVEVAAWPEWKIDRPRVVTTDEDVRCSSANDEQETKLR